MKLGAPIKLLTSRKQRRSLFKTIRAANAACNDISKYAHKNRLYGINNLQKAVYHDIREKTGISAQAACLCVRKVAACYRRDKKHQHRFRPTSAQPFDDRIFRLCDDDVVSIWTIDGRIKVPFVCGEYQRKMLVNRKGEVDLQLKGGEFYIVVTCDIEEAPPIDAVDAIGVDLGIVNIAYDSDGVCYSGEKVDEIRRIFSHRRRNLQRKKTRAAKRKLRAIAGRQARYQRDVNHCISKAIVDKAQRTDRSIVLEDLEGIRSRVTARCRRRTRKDEKDAKDQLSNWGFFQLRAFIEYKAKLRGVPVVFIDPAYTSQTCPSCGHIDRANRNKQKFLCKSCGCVGHADYFAALNIRAKGTVDCPNGEHDYVIALQGSVPVSAGQLQTTGF